MCDCNNCVYKQRYEKMKETAVKYLKNKRQKLIEAGKCSSCGKNDVMEKDGKKLTMCNECLQKQIERQKKYKERKYQK
jgi:hypothetical protein